MTISATNSLLGITGLVLLPLCLLRNLSSLAPFSLLGSAGMVYTALAMAVRYFGGAYAKGGKFAKAVAPALQPKFGSVGASGVFSTNAAILVAMLSTAYMVGTQRVKRRKRIIDESCIALHLTPPFHSFTTGPL